MPRTHQNGSNETTRSAPQVTYREVSRVPGSFSRFSGEENARATGFLIACSRDILMLDA